MWTATCKHGLVSQAPRHLFDAMKIVSLVLTSLTGITWIPEVLPAQ